MSLPKTTTRWRGELIDLVAVGRCLSGTTPRPTLTAVELEFTARVMTEAGLSAHDIGARLDVAQRTVTRWRATWTEVTR